MAVFSSLAHMGSRKTIVFMISLGTNEICSSQIMVLNLFNVEALLQLGSHNYCVHTNIHVY